MSDDLIRLEHKVDLIIRALQSSNLMLSDLPDLHGIEKDTCALCNTKITLTVNPAEGLLTRTCGCSLPKRAYKITISTPEEAENANNRTENIEVPPDRAE